MLSDLRVIVKRRTQKGNARAFYASPTHPLLVMYHRPLNDIELALQLLDTSDTSARGRQCRN